MEDIRSREFGEFLHSNGLADLDFAAQGLLGVTIGVELSKCGKELIMYLQHPVGSIAILLIRSIIYRGLLPTIGSFTSHWSPFHFEKFWLSYPWTWKIVREVWKLSMRGDTRYRVACCLELDY